MFTGGRSSLVLGSAALLVVTTTLGDGKDSVKAGDPLEPGQSNVQRLHQEMPNDPPLPGVPNARLPDPPNGNPAVGLKHPNAKAVGTRRTRSTSPPGGGTAGRDSSARVRSVRPSRPLTAAP